MRLRAWVRAILARYLRRFARAAGPERVFVRPLSVVRERWWLAARTCFPTIHLAIKPLLRPRLWWTHPTLALSAPRADVRGERDTTSQATEDRSRSTLVFTRVPAVVAQLRERASADTEARALLPPLALVFQRLRDPEHAIGAAVSARQQASERPVLAHRFAERSRRVERSPAGAPTRVIARPVADAPERQHARRHDTPAPIDGTESALPWVTRAASVPPNGSRHSATAPPQPPVNIAAIADRVMQQIDDRLHAWHERTGF
jgi:hypothetical protein